MGLTNVQQAIEDVEGGAAEILMFLEETKMEAPKVLADLWESVAGAILVDSSFDAEVRLRLWDYSRDS